MKRVSGVLLLMVLAGMSAFRGQQTVSARERQGQQFVEEVRCVATSRQVPGYIDEKFLVSDDGMSESPAGSGQWVVERRARSWNSNYGVVGGRNDESPIVEFQFARAETVSGMVVWNMPGPRGWSTATVQYAGTDGGWRFLPETVDFQPANGEGAIRGQKMAFRRPIRTDRIRLWCHGTHRGRYGQPDVAGLYRVRFVRSPAEAPPVPDSPDAPHSPDVPDSPDAPESPERSAAGQPRFPPDCGIVNVRDAPYLAQGDGITDDTQAIQRAMSDCQATRRCVYLPAGTYLVSDTLSFRPGYFHGDNNLRGDGVGRTIIRLKDGVAGAEPGGQPTAESLKAVIDFGYHGPPEGRVSADWFNNNIRDLTIDVGRNAGAIGLRYYSNNAGAARNLELRAEPGFGHIGLDLGYKDQNGPLLVQGLRVRGFAVGVSAGNSVNSQTLSDVVLEEQRELAVRNEGQCLTIERLRAEGPASRIQSNWGFLTLVDTTLASPQPVTLAAVESGEFLCVVNLRTRGFARSIASRYPEPREVQQPDVDEFFSAEVTRRDGDPGQGHLPRTPTPADDVGASATWANVRNFRRIDELDDAAAFQRAIDSGAEVVYLPAVGSITLGSTVTVRGDVRRIVGFPSQLRTLDAARPALRIESTRHPRLFIQDLIDVGIVENVGETTLVIQDIQGIEGRLLGNGEVFLENTVGNFELGPGQRVRSRQMNSERLGTKLINRGGELLIVGLKTERGGTLVETTDGGRSEVLGGLCYTTNQGQLAPMWVNRDASVWAAVGEVCYTGNPFRVLVREQVGEQVREWKRGEVPLRFRFLQGSALVYDGRR